MAQKHRDLRLSLLLTQVTGSHETRQLVRSQLENWRQVRTGGGDRREDGVTGTPWQGCFQGSWMQLKVEGMMGESIHWVDISSRKLLVSWPVNIQLASNIFLCVLR